MDRLQEKYVKEVCPEMTKKFGYKNVMELPKIEKVIINMGVGEAVGNPKALDAAVADLTLIAGQKPVVTRAKKSIATWKVRQGMPIGAKDFQGVSGKAFDGRGNYSVGLKEQLIFPEIDYDKIDKVRGMNVVIVTTAKTDEEAKELLALMGMPFAA